MHGHNDNLVEAFLGLLGNGLTILLSAIFGAAGAWAVASWQAKKDKEQWLRRETYSKRLESYTDLALATLKLLTLLKVLATENLDKETFPARLKAASDDVAQVDFKRLEVTGRIFGTTEIESLVGEFGAYQVHMNSLVDWTKQPEFDLVKGQNRVKHFEEIRDLCKKAEETYDKLVQHVRLELGVDTVKLGV